MRSYENLFILDPGSGEEEVKGEIEGIAKIIDKYQGKVETTNIWGRRILAYPIKEKKEGFYVLFEMKLLPERIRDIKRELDLKAKVLRYFILRKRG